MVLSVTKGFNRVITSYTFGSWWRTLKHVVHFTPFVAITLSRLFRFKWLFSTGPTTEDATLKPLRTLIEFICFTMTSCTAFQSECMHECMHVCMHIMTSASGDIRSTIFDVIHAIETSNLTTYALHKYFLIVCTSLDSWQIYQICSMKWCYYIIIPKGIHIDVFRIYRVVQESYSNVSIWEYIRNERAYWRMLPFWANIILRPERPHFEIFFFRILHTFNSNLVHSTKIAIHWNMRIFAKNDDITIGV